MAGDVRTISPRLNAPAPVSNGVLGVATVVLGSRSQEIRKSGDQEETNGFSPELLISCLSSPVIESPICRRKQHGAAVHRAGVLRPGNFAPLAGTEKEAEKE
jgi:hypothetical protein